MFLALLMSAAVTVNPLETGSLAAPVPRQAAAPKSKPAAKGKPATAPESAPRPRRSSAADAKSAQATDKSKAAAREADKPTAASRSANKQRLPRFFSRLELEDEQRQQVLEIQGRFAEQIAQLRQQIAQLQVERDEQLDGVLKTAQKRRLKQLRNATKAPEAGEDAPKTGTAAAPPPKKVPPGP